MVLPSWNVLPKEEGSYALYFGFWFENNADFRYISGKRRNVDQRLTWDVDGCGGKEEILPSKGVRENEGTGQ